MREAERADGGLRVLTLEIAAHIEEAQFVRVDKARCSDDRHHPCSAPCHGDDDREPASRLCCLPNTVVREDEVWAWGLAAAMGTTGYDWERLARLGGTAAWRDSRC